MPDVLEYSQHASPRVRSSVTRGLDDLAPAHPDVFATLLRLLDDDDEDVRSDAVRSLSGLDAPEVTSALVARLKTTSHPLPMIRVLSDLVSQIPDALPPLLVLLRDQDADVRRFAAWGLLKWSLNGNTNICEDRAPQVVQLLEQALTDKHGDVRRLAAGALGYLGPHAEECAATLTERLNDPKVVVRIKAASALGRIIGFNGDQVHCPPTVREVRPSQPTGEGHK